MAGKSETDVLGVTLTVPDWSVVVVSPHAGATVDAMACWSNRKTSETYIFARSYARFLPLFFLLRVQYGTVSIVETASTVPPFTGTVMVVLATIESFI